MKKAETHGYKSTLCASTRHTFNTRLSVGSRTRLRPVVAGCAPRASESLFFFVFFVFFCFFVFFVFFCFFLFFSLEEIYYVKRDGRCFTRRSRRPRPRGRPTTWFRRRRRGRRRASPVARGPWGPA